MKSSIDCRNFVKENLGKAITFKQELELGEMTGMIIGYLLSGDPECDLILVSFTSDTGFKKVPKEGVVLVHSPLSKTYWLVSPFNVTMICNMIRPIEKYIGKEDLKKMPINQAEIYKKIYTSYQGVGKDDIMLLSALEVYTRLFSMIYNLPEKQQLDIIHEVTMIAYDARIKAFEHMINYNPNNI